ncbi:hypothetical protein JW865_08790 [Candidatus Bathyarchaeota archaeon]|nr:hypothetical protein [Candidatus Bathyarchaeota archaeon]
MASEMLKVVPSSMGLLLRLPGIYTRLYFARRRALKNFKKELVKNGLTWEAAEELAQLYPDITKLGFQKYLKNT